MNHSIPILHDIANGVVYIVQTNFIELCQLDLPVMLRVIPLQPVDMKILYKQVKEVVSDHNGHSKGAYLGKSGYTSLKQFGA